MAGGVGALHGVIDDLAGAEVIGGFVAEELVELMRARDRLDAQIARRVGGLDAAGEWELDGSRSAAGWLVRNTRAAQADARRAVRTARQVRAMPEVAAAWAEGAITSAHVAVLARTRHAANASERFAAFEATFVEVAKAGTPEDVEAVARQWRDAVDAERGTSDSAEARQWDGRRLTLAQLLDGRVVLDGNLDAEGGSYVQRALANECERLRRKHDDRTAEQLRADALVNLMRRSLDAGTAGARRRPHVLFLTDPATVDGDEVGVSETERGVRLSPATMRRIACDAFVSVAWLGDGSEVLDLGRATRTFTEAQRRAIIAQYPTCVGLGCSVPAADCDLHHLFWWECGGPTDRANGVPACRADHHRLHEEGWTVDRDSETGEVHWYRPDGSCAGTVQPRTRPKPIRVRRRRDHLDDLIRARVDALIDECAGRASQPARGEPARGAPARAGP